MLAAVSVFSVEARDRGTMDSGAAATRQPGMTPVKIARLQIFRTGFRSRTGQLWDKPGHDGESVADAAAGNLTR